MGIREKINQHPRISTGVTAGIVVAAIGLIIWQLMGGSGSSGAAGSNKAFYTTDDTATGDAAVAALFVDENTKLPPFDHDGKQAYRANVFSRDGGKTKFVGYLQRYTPDAKEGMEKAMADMRQPPNPLVPSNGPILMRQYQINGMEVKKPGPGKWFKRTDPSSRAALTITAPDGHTDSIIPILPP